MGGLILCRRKAEIPLYIELSNINIYSMEELCYYLYHNIYAINKSFFNEELFDFLKHMEETALMQRLNTDILSGKKYISLVWTILSCVDYYSPVEKQTIHQELMEIMKRTPAENRKARADILREKKKYGQAIEEYYAVIEDETLKASEKNIADAWNNIGVIKAQAFFYREAVCCFDKAISFYEQKEYMDNLICALIMGEKCQEEELDFDVLKKEMVSKYDIEDMLIRKYKRVIEQEEREISSHQETEDFQNRMSGKDRDIYQYKKDVNEIISEWKTQYREQEKERQSK